MADTKKAFYEIKNSSFLEGDPRDEFLHPEARGGLTNGACDHESDAHRPVAQASSSSTDARGA